MKILTRACQSTDALSFSSKAEEKEEGGEEELRGETLGGKQYPTYVT